MRYELINACENDIVFLKESKLYNIFFYAHDLSEEQIAKINKYVEENIPKELNFYKIVKCDYKTIGCYLVLKKDDGVILDEIYLEEKYRNKGIGTDIIKNILLNNSIVYLWVYKENKKAISLYKKLGFKIIKETEIRYYMKYSKKCQKKEVKTKCF